MRSRSALRLGLAVTALAASTLLGPASASAAPVNCQAPPGTSGIDQYCETVPGAGGDQGTRGGGSHPRHHVGDSVSHRTAAALRNSAAGRAILGLTTDSSTGSSQGSGSGSGTGTNGGSSGTNGTSHRTGTGANGSAAGQGAVPSGRSDNPLQAVQSAAGTGTSAGPAFIWILVIVALVMAGLGWLRYRRSSTG